MASHLRQDMCELRRPGTRIGDISRSQVNEKQHRGIADFLETHFLFWLEALGLVGRLAGGVTIISSKLWSPRRILSGFQASADPNDPNRLLIGP
ncbi:hypothetical protein QBC38DRAFT_462444 [Podospora fimiseda]|uniref:Uncharacterized protein n=1 Tax=Podospora fimiseda TaxID=252190 RepID=A0AAN7BGA3_9PEZI|nr:hypothetical protein QBC38DRAFT_462444 [Podospora fimiseda]